MSGARRGWLPKVTRDTVLFVAGLYGFLHEVQSAGAVRMEILLVSAAFCGSPVFLRYDEARRDREPKP